MRTNVLLGIALALMFIAFMITCFDQGYNTIPFCLVTMAIAMLLCGVEFIVGKHEK